MPPSLVPRDYVLLALRLDRLAPGIVDTWTGDPALRRYAADGPAPVPAALARTARRLRAELADTALGPTRTGFLAAQLRALECLARRLAGEPVGFVEEVAACFDVDLAGVRPDEDRYRAAHRRLDELLPGPGTLPQRLTAFRERERVPRERLRAAVDALLAALRERTRARIGLPVDEHVEVELAVDRSWSGLTTHLGGLRSRVTVSADAGLRAAQLAGLVAHEAYPGHHTEHCLVRGVRRSDRPERGLVVTPSPHSLVTEGAADAGLAVVGGVVGGPGWGPWVAEVLADVGVRCDGPLAEAVEDALRELAPVRQDAALLLHDRGGDVDDAAAHLRRWLLVPDGRARRILRFVTDPRWRGYTTTYVEGEALVREWLDGAPDRVARYRTLFDEPLAPAQLRAAAASGPSAVGPPGCEPSGPTPAEVPETPS
ncbi:hypothetical protein Psed_0952 [Pseudonocardia dioxanivorans CB1190]|uniref:DUF885 domain-containing protein n=1 Tax=Pseudonocardia dioxanivorans (strain ATCC 55486 / DSM 44775 / JCM 13855 / CB1190) TaxID=675635 RepID=F4CIY4_PSEUX|nr:hypothetical protein [Pseudonocardia dioxanivorans]AEA23204.1 hypothetical protein Psed_0952 [Pseudonocardia dioxanivorans CB1190]